VKKILFILVLLSSIRASAQIDAFNGYCTQGSYPATTSGLNSSNLMQSLIPQCTVTVYNTGTTNLATIFSNATGTVLTNPFRASTKAQWLFFAANNQGYDVVMSGGIPPLTFLLPVTLTDLKVGTGGGGGSGVTNVTAGDLLPIFTTTVTTPTTTPNITFNLSSAAPNSILGNPTGVSGNPLYFLYSCTGFLACNYDTPSNTLTLNVPNTSALSITAVAPIRVNGGTGPVSSGTASIDCPTCGQVALQMQVLAPISGQYAIIYPTGGVITSDPVMQASIFGNGTTAAGGHFIWQCSGLLCSIAGANQAHWTGFALPSWLAARTSDITAIYADAITAAYPQNPVWAYTDSFSGTTVTCNSHELMVTPTAYPYAAQERSALTGLTGATFDANAECHVQVGGSGPGSTGQTVDVSAIRFLVYYTGAPGPANPATLNIQPPLSWDQGTNTLFLNQSDNVAGHEQFQFFQYQPPASSYPAYTAKLFLNTADCVTPHVGTSSECITDGTNWSMLWNSSGGGGGGDTITSPNSTLNVGGTTTNTTLDLNLTHANTWTSKQTQPAPIFPDLAGGGTQCLDIDNSGQVGVTGSACGAGGGGLTGQTINYLPKATSSNASTTSSVVEDTGVGIIIHGTGTTHGAFFPASTGTPSPVASNAGIGSDSSSNLVGSDNGGAFARICTATNGVCAAAFGTYFTESVTCTTTCSLTHTPTTFINFARNGIDQRSTTDFSVSSSTVTLVVAATGGDTFYAQYFY
jgi:hypothetical protein